MDVIIENKDDGRIFRMEVGYFDTVLDVKSKIKEYRDIPIDHQILIFNGKILDHDSNVESCSIAHNSHIHLHLIQPEQNEVLLILQFRNIGSTYRVIQVEKNLSDSVLQFKDKIRGILELTTESIGLYLDEENELKDDNSLSEYALSHGSKILIDIKPPLTPLGSSCFKKMNILVLVHSTQTVIVIVYPTDKVQVIRGLLEELQGSWNFKLPKYGYYFVHKGHGVVDESRSFLENNVCEDDDMIEIFDGTVTQ